MWNFTAQDTKIVKGCALILMICNHLFPIAEWIYPENQFISISIGQKTMAAYIGSFGKICVSIFAFLTGYGLYFTYKNKKTKFAYKHTLLKLIKFLLTYWIILIFIYLPIMRFTNVLKWDIKEFLLNLFGYKTTYCRIAWYVRVYIELIITFPLWNTILKKYEKTFQVCIIVLLLSLIKLFLSKFPYFLIGTIFSEYITYTIIVIVGNLIARKDYFCKFRERIKKINNVFLYLLIMALIFIGRGFLGNMYLFNMDTIYVPIFIFSFIMFIQLINIKLINKALITLGNYSIEMWFLHAIFFIGNSTVQKIGYWPKLDILILTWIIILLLPISKLVKKLENFIEKIFIKASNRAKSSL